MTLLKTDHPGFLKNPRTGVLQNTNEGQLHTLQAQRKKAREYKKLLDRINRLEQEVEQLKNKIR